MSVDSLIIASVVLCLAACGTTDGESAGSSTGVDDGGTATSDATSGGTAGDESGSETGGVDMELEQLCTAACGQFLECAPVVYGDSYVDDAECISICEILYSVTPECRAVSPAYLQCNIELSCADWDALLTDPATTSCADAWAPVMTECSLG